MAIVIKTIRGRQYRYAQRSYRINGKVKTKSVYLGPVGGRVRRKGVLGRLGEFITTNFQHEHIFDMEALESDSNRRCNGRPLILLEKLLRASIMPLPDGATSA
jgi:hypothetical protein